MSYTPPVGNAVNFTDPAGQSYTPPSGSVDFVEDYPGYDSITGTVNFTIPSGQSYSPPTQVNFSLSYLGLDAIPGGRDFITPTGQSYTPPTVPISFYRLNYGRQDFTNPSGQSYSPPSAPITFNLGYAGLDTIPGGRDFTVSSGQSYSPPSTTITFTLGYAGLDTIPGGRDFTVPSGQSYSAPAWNAVNFTTDYAGYDPIPGGRDFTVQSGQSYSAPSSPITFSLGYPGAETITDECSFTVYPNQNYTPQPASNLIFGLHYAAPYQRPTIYDSLDAEFIWRYILLVKQADACFCAPTKCAVEANLEVVVPEIVSVEIEGWRDRNWIWIPEFPVVVPDMVARIRERPYMVTMDASFPAIVVPAMTFAGTGEQDTAMTDADGRELYTSQEQCTVSTNPIGYYHQHGLRLDGKVFALQTTGAWLNNRLSTPSQDMLRTTRKLAGAEQQMIPVHGWLESPHAEMIVFRRNRLRMEETNSIKVASRGFSGHAEQIRTRLRKEVKEQQAIPVYDSLGLWGAIRGLPLAIRLLIQQQQALLPSPGMFWPYIHPECQGLWADFSKEVQPYAILIKIADASFQGRNPYHYHPNLSCPELAIWVPKPPPPPPPPPEPIVIPILEVYIVSNNVTMMRADDNTPIHVFKVSITSDSGTWAWGMSASIGYAELDKVAPDAGGPVEVKVNVNGTQWNFLVESYSTDETFGSKSISIKGRSVTALLDAPYAPLDSEVFTQAYNALQIANAQLTKNGNSGFTLEWGIADTLGDMVELASGNRYWGTLANPYMTAGSYTYTSKTPLQVIAEITGGLKGYLQSHPSEKKLIALSGYPIRPWMIDDVNQAIDFVIPRSVLLSQSLSWSQKPDYNGIFVSGDRAGVVGKVKRNGTAGDELMETFTSPFIMDTTSAYAAGVASLGTAGPQAEITISIPLDATYGPVLPGKILEVDNWRGISRGINIDANWSSNSMSVLQSISIERHY